MGFVTVRDLARELGRPPDNVRKKLRSFMKCYNIPPSRVMKKDERGVWRYVLDEELYREFMRYIQPKIRIEVNVQ